METNIIELSKSVNTDNLRTRISAKGKGNADKLAKISFVFGLASLLLAIYSVI